MISKKNFILICLIVIFSFSICSARDLEIDYPEIGGYQPEEVSTPLPEYVKYIFNFSIWIIGFVAFGFILIGGFRYLTSSGNPTIQSDSKNQIFSALLGIIILISSYLILETINPELKVFMISIFWLIILSWFAQIVVGIILLWKKKILNAKLKKLKRPVEIGEISSHGGIGRHT